MAAPAADAPTASEDALPEFHRGVIRDVEAVKGELDRLVDKVRSAARAGGLRAMHTAKPRDR